MMVVNKERINFGIDETQCILITDVDYIFYLSI